MNDGDATEGWVWARLSQLSAPTRNAFTIGPFGSNLKVSDYRDAGVPLVFVRDIRAEAFGGPGTRYVSPEKAEELASHSVRPGDLLVTKMGEPPGDTAIYPPDRPIGIISADCIKLTPHTALTSSEFLRLSIRSPVVHDQVVEQTMGVAQQKLSLARFRDIRTPLPPLAEQHRIVATVEALLGQVNRARGRLDRVSLILKRFRQAVLAVACSDGDDVEVGDIIESIRYGTAVRCSPEAAGTPVLRIPNVVQGVIDTTELKYGPLSPSEKRNLNLDEGDLLMIRSNGSVGLVGRTAVVTSRETSFSFAGYLMRLRPDRRRVLPGYLQIALQTSDVRAQVEMPARSTSGVHNINTEEVRRLRISLPSVERQARVLAYADRLRAYADTVERRVQAAVARADKLPRAILSKAFSGELVPTEAELARAEGRAYETAEQLLARVAQSDESTERLSRTRVRRVSQAASKPTSTTGKKRSASKR